MSQREMHVNVPDEVSDRALILGRFLSNKSYVEITIQNMVPIA
jgi:hypothetical protein